MEFHSKFKFSIEYPFIRRIKVKAYEIYCPEHDSWKLFSHHELKKRLEKELSNSKFIKEIQDEIIEEYRKHRIKITYNEGGKYSSTYEEYFDSEKEILEYYDKLKVLLRPFLQLSDINSIKDVKMTK